MIVDDIIYEDMDGHLRIVGHVVECPDGVRYMVAESNDAPWYSLSLSTLNNIKEHGIVAIIIKSGLSRKQVSVDEWMLGGMRLDDGKLAFAVEDMDFAVI